MQGNLTVKQIADSPQRAMKEQHKIGKFGPEKRKLLHLPELSLKDKKTSVPEVISRVGTEKKMLSHHLSLVTLTPKQLLCRKAGNAWKQENIRTPKHRIHMTVKPSFQNN